MTWGNRIDRRQEKTRAFRLVRPAYIQIPKTVAAPLFLAAALLVFSANHLTGSTIWFGPVYLLICAFSAWFVGNRFAITLGLLLISVQILSSQILILSKIPAILSINLALQFFSALAIVLMLGIAREALEIEWKYARIDPLTGALNRKAFFEVVEANSDRRNLSVLVYADIDGLKQLNDHRGHKEGDEALRHFANRVKSLIRKDDLFARIGGDEFVILLNVRDGVAAKAVADRLNKMLNLQTGDDQVALKCSLGVLLLPTGSSAIDEELKLADALMYEAKKEQAGFTMGWSVTRNIGEKASTTPVLTPTDTQSSATRTAERHHDSGQSHASSTKSHAA